MKTVLIDLLLATLCEGVAILQAAGLLVHHALKPLPLVLIGPLILTFFEKELSTGWREQIGNDQDVLIRLPFTS